MPDMGTIGSHRLIPPTFPRNSSDHKHRTLFNLRNIIRNIPQIIAAGHWTAVLGLSVALMGCTTPEPGRHRPTAAIDTDIALPSDGTPDDLDFGDDWATVEAALSGTRPGPGKARPARPGRGPSGNTDVRAGDVAITLATFTGERHARTATTARNLYAQRAPELARDLGVHSDERGSMVVYGRYTSFDDPTLRADLKRLKAFTVDGKRIFGLVLPAQLRTTLKLDDLDPLNLHRVRLQLPDTRVLYTLEVAWWGPTGQGGPPHDAGPCAEAMAKQLRRDGHEAWFLHEPHRRRSSVCVGVFDYTAKDASSDLESGQVMAVRREFPAVLINGQPRQARGNPADPASRTRPVPPLLIDIPRP